MGDIQVLKEMFNDSVIIPLEPNPHNETKKQISLKEEKYFITISGMPDDFEVVVIKPDAFSGMALKAIFNDNLEKGICKRADFAIIANTGKQKIIVVIECKAGTSKRDEIIQQLKGAKCFITYCQEIGKMFWDNKNFLNDYEYRYVSIKNIMIRKKPTRKSTSQLLHDKPERMLKITSPKYLEFRHLINKGNAVELE